MPHEKFQECIDACNASVIACEHCASSCLQEADPKAMARCISLDRTCADICALAVREMARGSEFSPEICRLCADVCRACGAECTRHDAQHCRDCAEACFKCADVCQQMAAVE